MTRRSDSNQIPIPVALDTNGLEGWLWEAACSIRGAVDAPKWASCSSSGANTFSRELLDLDRDFGEAVIVHELVHLKVPNHGKLFRSLVQSFTRDRLPDVSEDRAK